VGFYAPNRAKRSRRVSSASARKYAAKILHGKILAPKIIFVSLYAAKLSTAARMHATRPTIWATAKSAA
jgi:hypothetical protein